MSAKLTRSRRSAEEVRKFWEELRGLYEQGGYSQRDLINYARLRGFRVSQSTISRKAMEESWIKGTTREEIQRKVEEALREKIGEELGKMLKRHRELANAAQFEVIKHFERANEVRKIDPKHVIPAALLRQLISGLHEAIDLEARALGFDYRSGRPFSLSDDDSVTPAKMEIKVMTPEDEAEVRRRAEESVESDD